MRLIATGALGGAATAFILTSLLLDGFSEARWIACIAGAAIGAVVYPEWPRTAWSILAVAAVLWTIAAFSPAARVLSNGLVRSDPVPSSVDAVVVLSGSVSDDGMLGSEALDRLLSALALVRAGRSSMLVITQPHPLPDARITTNTDQRRLIGLLPSPVRVVVVDNVVSTRTEATGTARQLAPATAPSIAVVTSPLHTLRACAVFEHIGYRVSCVPAESRDFAIRSLGSAHDRLAAFRMALSERAAAALYRYRGWM